jgi:hypothetical protein
MPVGVVQKDHTSEDTRGKQTSTGDSSIGRRVSQFPSADTEKDPAVMRERLFSVGMENGLEEQRLERGRVRSRRDHAKGDMWNRRQGVC